MPVLFSSFPVFVVIFVSVTFINPLHSTTMAKILTTAIVADIRNKLNGSVFSKNRYGSYVRTKVTPVNPQSVAQQTQRNLLATYSQAWRGLTEAQRQGWIDTAPNFPFTDIYGNTKILSGQALFVKLNINLASYGGTPINDAPAPIAVPALNSVTFTLTETGPTASMAFDPSPVPADFAIAIFTTGNVAPGKSFVKNLYRKVTYINPAQTTPQNLLSAFQAIHGNPVAGQKVFTKAFMVSQVTGQAGIPTMSVDIVGA